jgi:hypothetical protein
MDLTYGPRRWCGLLSSPLLLQMEMRAYMVLAQELFGRLDAKVLSPSSSFIVLASTVCFILHFFVDFIGHPSQSNRLTSFSYQPRIANEIDGFLSQTPATADDAAVKMSKWLEQN